jgi:hypothetical protein
VRLEAGQPAVEDVVIDRIHGMDQLPKLLIVGGINHPFPSSVVPYSPTLGQGQQGRNGRLYVALV